MVIRALFPSPVSGIYECWLAPPLHGEDFTVPSLYLERLGFAIVKLNMRNVKIVILQNFTLSLDTPSDNRKFLEGDSIENNDFRRCKRWYVLEYLQWQHSILRKWNKHNFSWKRRVVLGYPQWQHDISTFAFFDKLTKDEVVWNKNTETRWHYTAKVFQVWFWLSLELEFGSVWLLRSESISRKIK